LERAGLVRRHATADGRRVRSKRPPRHEDLEAGRKRRVESLAKALSSFTEKEQQQVEELTDLLQQVIRNL